MRTPRCRFLTAALLAAGLAAPGLSAQQTTVRDSSRHPAISPPRYSEHVRESVYITVRDGTRLAADVFRPVENGAPVADPLPLIWTHDRYHRSSRRGGRTFTKIDQPEMLEMLRRGYLVAAVDVRGAGASFGAYDGPLNPNEITDAYDVMEWFAAQPWCDGNLGMYGGSYLGATQYLAAASNSPHLKAIIPSVAPADLYAFCYAGGIYRSDFLANWSQLTRMLDTTGQVLPVDADADGELLREATAAHSGNRDTDEQFRELPFRDSTDARLGQQPNLSFSPITYAQAISASGVAVYHLGGWFDCFSRDTLLLYSNLETPQRIAMGPWFHQQRHEFDNLGEHLRWFDRWLKGIENGIDEEPPVHYYTLGAPQGQEWRSARQWPLPEEARTEYFLVGGRTGPANGTLSRTRPAEAAAVDYTVDYGTTSGGSNRWRNGYGGPGGYGDRSENDRRGISFTSAALEADTEITGHPVAQLWIRTSARDADFFVYLEEVEADGSSRYVTEGCLRASHRALHEPPYDYLGLPWHRSFAEDVQDLAAAPARLLLDLQPTSNVFDAGHRIRITVTCADRDNQETPVLDPPPVVTLLAGPEHASSVVLPVIPAQAAAQD